MQQRESSGSQWSTVLFLVCLATGIASAALWLWPTADTAVATPPPTLPGEAQPIESVTTDIAMEQAVQPPERVEVVVAAASTPPLRGFENYVAQLCDMGVRVAELAQDDEIEEARALDREIRTLLDEVLQQFPDAGERSLGMVVEMAAVSEVQENPAQENPALQNAPLQNEPLQIEPLLNAPLQNTPLQNTPLQNTRLGVLQVLLQRDLARRHQLAGRVGDRARIDALVQFVLDSMPIDARTAEMGNRCLHQAPYLRGAHEPGVLNLLQLAGKDQFSRDIATNLLLTLWDNMLASGERTSAELSQLALLRLDGKDPSEILLACRQLLADANYRAVALAWLRERQDRSLAGDIAELAAQELPVRDALEVLRELSPLLGHRRGTYLALGARGPEVIADAYRQHLAANNQPEIRRELIMGVGMLPGAAGLKLAELAIANDPSPEVRIQAMFVFTVHAPPAAAEQAVSQLLDEPAIANNQIHLGAIVMALQNLEHGDPNTIARLGARLQTMPLSAQSREHLNLLMARSLPNGGNTPRPGGR